MSGFDHKVEPPLLEVKAAEGPRQVVELSHVEIEQPRGQVEIGTMRYGVQRKLEFEASAVHGRARRAHRGDQRVEAAGCVGEILNRRGDVREVHVDLGAGMKRVKMNFAPVNRDAVELKREQIVEHRKPRLIDARL